MIDLNLAKAQAFAWRLADTFSASHDVSEQLRQTADIRRDLERQVQRDIAGHGPANADTVRHLEAERDREASLRARHDTNQRAIEPLGRFVARMREFLAHKGIALDALPPQPTVLFRPVEPTPALADLDGLAAEIAALRKARRGVADAPLAREEFEARVDAELDRKAAATESVNVSTLLRTQPTRLNLLGELPEVAGPLQHVHDRELLEGFLALVARGPIRKVIVARATELVEKRDGWGLPQAEREATLRQLDERLFTLELRRERVRETLERVGLFVSPAADADVGAVLALPDEIVAPTGTAPDDDEPDADSRPKSPRPTATRRVGRSSYLANSQADTMSLRDLVDRAPQ